MLSSETVQYKKAKRTIQVINQVAKRQKSMESTEKMTGTKAKSINLIRPNQLLSICKPGNLPAGNRPLPLGCTLTLIPTTYHYKSEN
ncbi:MAG TPA: hypothetical protein VK152_11705 [Paludibacter sp.]|nr:hypothetical protein [Paludibacter sp.]